MSGQAIWWMFVFTMCNLISVILAKDSFECFNVHYAGPINEVIQMKPTKLAEKTSEAAAVGREFGKVLAANALRQIPVVGFVLGPLFEGMAELFGGRGLDPADVYNSLMEEINEIREYIDQEIAEAKLDCIRRAFGASRGDMLGCDALPENVQG